MLSNAAYNLMETASVLSKGLYRYDQFLRDAGGCEHCQQLWRFMKQRDEEQLRTLLPHLKQHLEHEPTVAAAA